MKKAAGFTLIEMLVVVAIIGFLAIIGIAIYADVQARGRDSKRKADLDSVAKVLEVYKAEGGTYQPLDDDYFGSTIGMPKTDPQGKPYCLSATATADPTNTSSWSACSGINATWVELSESVPANTTTSWKLCTYLEKSIKKGGGTATNVYCRYSSQ